MLYYFFFFFNDTATTEIYTLSLHDALPICWYREGLLLIGDAAHVASPVGGVGINLAIQDAVVAANVLAEDRKSTRLNSSHANISYAVFCLKKKKKKEEEQ